MHRKIVLGLFVTIAIVTCGTEVSASDVQYHHDAMGRVTQIDYGNGNVIDYTYDAVGNRKSRIVSGTATLPSPILVVTPMTVTMAQSQSAGSFQVGNGTGGSMEWSAAVTSGSGWLSITSGASGVNSGTVHVWAQTNYGAMPREGAITVDAPGATGSPAVVRVVQAAIAEGIVLSDGTCRRDYDDLCGESYVDEFSEVIGIHTREAISRSGRGVFRFDLSGLSPGAALAYKLRLCATFESEYVTNDFHASRIVEDWDPGQMNWCNRLAATPWCSQGVCFSAEGQATTAVPALYGSGGSGERTTWVEWDVTQIVEAWLSGAEPNYGICVWQTPLGSHSRNQAISFASMDNLDAGTIGPQLVAVLDSTVSAVEVGHPTAVALGQNYPNPFNPLTTISFSLPKAKKVFLAVYSVNGTLVRTLVNEYCAGDVHHVTWDGTDDTGRSVSSGIYFYQLVAGDETRTHKMVLLK